MANGCCACGGPQRGAGQSGNGAHAAVFGHLWSTNFFEQRVEEEEEEDEEAQAEKEAAKKSVQKQKVKPFNYTSHDRHTITHTYTLLTHV